MKEISLKQRKSIAGRAEKSRGISGRTGLAALFRKELADHLRSKRFLILLLLVGATSFASLYGAISGLGEAMESDSNFVFLKLYSTSGNSIPSFMAIIALLGPIIGLALGFDAVNSERTSGTLNRLVSQPIYRDSIIIGKFLAGTALIAMIIYSIGIGMGAFGVIATGLKPETEEVLRILIFLTFTVIYVSFWLALSIFFSVVCRHAATSALASIAVWMFFAIFMSLLATIIAGAVYPVNNDYNAMVNALDNYNLELGLNRISPSYLYSEAVSTIMNPSVRTVNIVTVDQLVGAISGYLSLGQSLLLVWPHLTGLAALLLVAFGASYIGFMRQEVRSN
ncbi:ABC transporter permease [Parablautia sp. Marseille-Q6255]|uniref:ABC transporter permease n=1 Tax=Parablautia sp. Marseille-Q6255 TaxID=3039593 RepID=UPI0024BC5EF9|nr:ABC transporter permease subunit [Parablautia sp. Marseille-Q6255]